MAFSLRPIAAARALGGLRLALLQPLSMRAADNGARFSGSAALSIALPPDPLLARGSECP